MSGQVSVLKEKTWQSPGHPGGPLKVGSGSGPPTQSRCPGRSTDPAGECRVWIHKHLVDQGMPGVDFHHPRSVPG